MLATGAAAPAEPPEGEIHIGGGVGVEGQQFTHLLQRDLANMRCFTRAQCVGLVGRVRNATVKLLMMLALSVVLAEPLECQYRHKLLRGLAQLGERKRGISMILLLVAAAHEQQKFLPQSLV